MSLDYLKKIAEEARQASVRPALWEPYQLYNTLADGVEELLGRVETTERELDEYRDGTTIVKLTEAERTLQRIRELHTRDQGYCGACDRLWPCPTVRAMEGDE